MWLRGWIAGGGGISAGGRAFLELGALLSTEVSGAASAARLDQSLYRAMRDYPMPTMDDDPGRERRERQIWDQRQKASQSSYAFTDLVQSRLDWLCDVLVWFEPESEAIVEFFRFVGSSPGSTCTGSCFRRE